MKENKEPKNQQEKVAYIQLLGVEPEVRISATSVSFLWEHEWEALNLEPDSQHELALYASEISTATVTLYTVGNDLYYVSEGQIYAPKCCYGYFGSFGSVTLHQKNRGIHSRARAINR